MGGHEGESHRVCGCKSHLFLDVTPVGADAGNQAQHVRCKVEAVRGKRLRVFAAITIGSIFAVGCNEVSESHYSTAAAAAQAGAFTRGWLPDLLQPDVLDIYESHDLDSSEVEGRFALNDGVIHRIQSGCRTSMKIPERARSALSATPSSANAVRCGDFLVTIDTAKRTGYFWSNGR